MAVRAWGQYVDATLEVERLRGRWLPCSFKRVNAKHYAGNRTGDTETALVSTSRRANFPNCGEDRWRRGRDSPPYRVVSRVSDDTSASPPDQRYTLVYTTRYTDLKDLLEIAGNLRKPESRKVFADAAPNATAAGRHCHKAVRPAMSAWLLRLTWRASARRSVQNLSAGPCPHVIFNEPPCRRIANRTIRKRPSRVSRLLRAAPKPAPQRMQSAGSR